MGNRAVIKPINDNIGVYLHWNGGLDSVTAFLKYCELKGYRDFGGKNADGYGLARFCQVVGNYLGGTTSIGIENISIADADYYDNGIYIIDGWKIVERIGSVTSSEGYDLTEMLCKIDEAQPAAERLTKKYITAEIVKPEQLQVGDKVYVKHHIDGIVSVKTVIGFGANCKFCNGRNVTGIPYINLYGNDFQDNINNYLFDEIRKVKNNN